MKPQPKIGGSPQRAQRYVPYGSYQRNIFIL